MLVLSLAPLVYSVWKISNTHDEKELGSIIESVIQHGELVLVCVCLLGAVIGDLIRSNTKWRISRIVFGGLAVALFFFATNAFADIAIATASVTCPL